MKVLVVHIWLLLLLLCLRNGNLVSAQCSNPPVLCCPGHNNGCNRGCYCDEICMTMHDCCPDYYQTCIQWNSQPALPSSPSPSILPSPPTSILPNSTILGPSSSPLPIPPTSSSSITSPSANSQLSSPSPPSSSTWTTPDPPTSQTSEPPSSSSQSTNSPTSSFPANSQPSSPSPPSSSTWTTPDSPTSQTSEPPSASSQSTNSPTSSLSIASQSDSSTLGLSSSSSSSGSSLTSAPSSSSPSPTPPTSSSPITSSSDLSGQCSVPTVLCCPGHNNGCYRGCFCDEVCLIIGDCCSDYNQTCIQTNSQPSSPSPPSTWTTPHSLTLSSSQVCNNCTENEACQERGGVYGCGCLQGQRPNPEIFDAVESCASSTGSISLSRCQLFESGFYPETLHLNDPSCKGTLENGRLLFYFDNEGHICGTTLTSNSTHFIYQNSIQSNPRNTEQSIISRDIWMNMTFSCAYPLIQTLSMPMGFRAEGGVISNELPAGQGTYQMRMMPYHDAQFTSPYVEEQVQVNQQMYVAVEVEGVDRNQIATVLDNCWATPVNDAEYHIRWNLIIKECPNPEDPTVEVLQNGIDTTSHFSFRMFTFSGVSDHVFLHCEVHLCLVQNGRCALSCNHGYRSRRQRSVDFLHSAAISMGLKAQ